MLRCAYLELSFEEVQVPILGVARCSSGSLCSSQLVMAVLQVNVKPGLLLQGTGQLFSLSLQGFLSSQKLSSARNDNDNHNNDDNNNGNNQVASPAHAVTDMGIQRASAWGICTTRPTSLGLQQAMMQEPGVIFGLTSPEQMSKAVPQCSRLV